MGRTVRGYRGQRLLLFVDGGGRNPARGWIVARRSSAGGLGFLLWLGLLLCAGVGVAGSAMAEPPPAALPLSEIVLYSSGVGYFQRDGVMNGRQEIELRFKGEQINDLLKSMVVQDLDGGQARAVTYDSRDPMAKTLKTFAVDVTANIGLSQLLERIRGEAVEVAAPGVVRGVILGVERKREKVSDKEAIEVEYLSLVTPDGLRSIPFSQIQRVRIENARLNEELQQALQILASGRDTQRKAVRFEFDGTGRRRVRVGYIAETPVWKTSYRLALTEGKPAFLQGWAIVENTGDEDWRGVRLALVSGRPISFTMDLYEPLYAKRPVVVSELYESLRPQVYDQAMEARAEEKAARDRAEASMARMAPRVGEAAVMRPAAPASRPLALQEGVSSAAETREAGELFEYRIREPLTLLRHKSAMLPIVNGEVAGEKLSIYNERVHVKYPLNGFRLKNTSGLHLQQGPITVFDGGTYAGDARIESLPAGQERLISYALDLKAEVDPKAQPGSEELVAASLRKGVLLVSRKAVQEKTYAVASRDTKPKTVLVEHPRRAEWTLVAPGAPAERTRDAYRFAVPVAAGATASLTVREERRIQESVRIADSGPDVIGIYLQARQVSPKVKEALQKIVALRNQVEQTVTRRSRLEQRSKEIGEEQRRIRENMARLPQNSELYARYVGVLGQQETELDKLRVETENQRNTEARQRRELQDFLLGLEID